MRDIPPSWPRCRLLIAAAFALALIAPPASTAKLTLSDRTERIGPGIALRHFQTLARNGWTDAQVLSVDLERRGLEVDLLTAPNVAAAAPISEQARAADAVAGVNGDFFDINRSDAALGFEIKGGELRKSAQPGWPRVALVGDNGHGRLARLSLDASLSFGGAEAAVTAINVAEGGPDSIVVYDHQWGDHPRSRGTGGASPVREVIVSDGLVSSVGSAPGAGALPAGTIAAVGREAGADALGGLEPGDPVDFRYRLDGGLASPPAFAIGGPAFLVRDGIVPRKIPDEEGPAPRTAIGFDEGGRRMLLAIADGRQGRVVRGPTRLEMAKLMAALGADDAMLLDGGGSTTLVARALGESETEVRNAPSGGFERSDPNGVGLFLAPGDGVPRRVVITPGVKGARVFPGLRRAVSAKAIDSRDSPVSIDAAQVHWDASAGAVSGRHYRAPAKGPGTVRLRAASNGAAGGTRLEVLGPLRSLEPSRDQIALPDAQSEPVPLRVTGRDAEGFGAPIDPADLKLSYDHSMLSVTRSGGGLSIAPRGNGVTTLEIAVGDEATEVPVTVGFLAELLRGFDLGLLLPQGELELTLPALAPTSPPVRDRLIAPHGVLPRGGGGFEFAAISDLQLNAAEREQVPAAIQALRRIRSLNPDFVVLNGDIAESGSEVDLALARQVLEEAGCELVSGGRRLPKPSLESVPCLYVPGNQEADETGSLEGWEAEFGPPYRVFDHRGVRFVLLNSSRGKLRTSDWGQLPMLQRAIKGAALSPAIRGLVVFAHHPIDDPGAADARQLGERKEVALVKRMLSDFRAGSGKGAAMIGGHARVAAVDRAGGVPYMVTPSLGEAAEGAAGIGGFTGWVRFGLDPSSSGSGDWLRADVRAFAREVALEAPDSIEVGERAPIGGELVQPGGPHSAPRRIPLRYPLSVHWSGSTELAIGHGRTAMRSARRKGRVAILDPVRGTITGLRAGAVTIAVESDRLDYPDPLAPGNQAGRGALRATRVLSVHDPTESR